MFNMSPHHGSEKTPKSRDSTQYLKNSDYTNGKTCGTVFAHSLLFWNSCSLYIAIDLVYGG